MVGLYEMEAIFRSSIIAFFYVVLTSISLSVLIWESRLAE